MSSFNRVFVQPSFTLQVQVTDSATLGSSDTAILTMQLNDLIGAADPTVPISGGGPPPDPVPNPAPDPGPTGGGGDSDGGEIDLGGDAGAGGGNPAPAPEPQPELQPAPVIAAGGDADGQPSGALNGQTTEPAPIVKRESARSQMARSNKLEMGAKTPGPSRPGDHIMVFSEAVEIMSEGVGTTDILEEVTSNPVQAAFKGSSFALSAGFLTWALRGASLLASVAASLPAWQGFDPLPVLAAKKSDKKVDEGDDNSDDDWQEKRIQRLFNPTDTADHA